jgi:hypothetical protein
MARILSYPRCEVFVNIMIEFINPFLEHPNDRILALPKDVWHGGGSEHRQTVGRQE